MNWVEHKVKREAVLDSGANDLWQETIRALADVINSYNSHYAAGKPVQLSKEKDRLSITRKLAVATAEPGSPRVEDVSLTILFDPLHHEVNATCANSLSIGQKIIRMEADEDGRVFLSHEGKELDEDKATEILTKEFLFHPRFSVR